MNLKTLFTDDDAVSPVIGVILMVAITVILAAVIGAFVLDLGSSQEKAPQVSFDQDYSGDSSATNDGFLTFSHESGASVNEKRLSFSASGGSTNVTSGNTWADYGSSTVSAGNDVSAGDSVTLDVTSGSEVGVVWTSESGDTSSELTNYEVP